MTDFFTIRGERSTANFAIDLANRLGQDKKTLILPLKREEDINLEELLDKDGLISFDLGDYLNETVDLSKVLVKEKENLYFIIYPLLEDKVKLKPADIQKLVTEGGFDQVIVINPPFPLELGEKSVDLIYFADLSYVESEYFALQNIEMDDRLFKSDLEGGNSKYLGFYNEETGEAVDNFFKGQPKEIEKLGFFQRLRLKKNK